MNKGSTYIRVIRVKIENNGENYVRPLTSKINLLNCWLSMKVLHLHE